jgi:hypothetical protein
VLNDPRSVLVSFASSNEAIYDAPITSVFPIDPENRL